VSEAHGKQKKNRNAAKRKQNIGNEAKEKRLGESDTRATLNPGK